MKRCPRPLAGLWFAGVAKLPSGACFSRIASTGTPLIRRPKTATVSSIHSDRGGTRSGAGRGGPRNGWNPGNLYVQSSLNP